MRRTTVTAVVVGIFFVVGVLLLIWFSLRVQGVGQRANANIYYAEFDKVSGLHEGAPVTLAGVEVGSVTDLRYDDARRKVVVELAVLRDHRIRRKDVVAVKLQSLLGHYSLNIRPGDVSAKVVPSGETLPSVPVTDLDDLMGTLSSLSGNAGGVMQSFGGQLTSVTQQVSQVIAENRENLRRTTEAFAQAAPKLETLATSISVAVAAFNEIARDLREGKGTLGRLLQDEDLYYNASDTAGNLRAITKKIREGEGTVGKLVNDDALHGELEKTFASLREASDEVRSILKDNRTDIEKTLASLGKVGDDLGQAADNLAAITDKVRKGEGTLGALVNDRSLYDDVRSALDQIRRTFEQTEEQGVVRTFLGVVLGAAQ